MTTKPMHAVRVRPLMRGMNNFSRSNGDKISAIPTFVCQAAPRITRRTLTMLHYAIGVHNGDRLQIPRPTCTWDERAAEASGRRGDTASLAKLEPLDP